MVLAVVVVVVVVVVVAFLAVLFFVRVVDRLGHWTVASCAVANVSSQRCRLRVRLPCTSM